MKVEGLDQTIKTLRQLDKESLKSMRKDFKTVAKPLVDNARAKQPGTYPLSRMENSVMDKNRGFKYEPKKTRSGIIARASTKAYRRAHAICRVTQRDPAGAMVDMAGKTTDSVFARNLTAKLGKPSRFMWPAADQSLPSVTYAAQQVIDKWVAHANQLLARQA